MIINSPALKMSLGVMLLAGSAGLPTFAQESYLEVGEQEPITILVNSSPWYNGFEAVVDLYMDQTGNQVDLDVTPYGGMLEKARNSVRGSESPHDILNIDSGWTIEFYTADYLRPLDSVVEGYQMPEEVFDCGQSFWWDDEKQWRTKDTGELMAVPPNCNTHVLVYRTDLFEEAELTPPETYDDLLATCQKINEVSGDHYGFLTRGERGNAIVYDFSPFFFAYGADWVADAQNGDFTVTLNSPEALEALNRYIEVQTTCGPENIGSVGQADMIQLMASDRVGMVQSVIAAWANFQDPQRSAVAGKVAAAELPHVGDAKPGVPIGNWNFGIPKNIPDERAEAAMAFIQWFLTEGAQTEYAKAGGIPVRSDVLEALSGEPEYAWMDGYSENLANGRQSMGFAEAASVEEVLGLRLNQALIGELAPAEALNMAAEEVEKIFADAGRETGSLQPLPEE